MLTENVHDASKPVRVVGVNRTGHARNDPPQFRLHEAIRKLALYSTNLFTQGNTPKQYKISYGVEILRLSMKLYGEAKTSLDKFNRPLYKDYPIEREIIQHRTRCKDDARLWAHKAEETYIQLKSCWELLLEAPGMEKRRGYVFALEADIGKNLGGWLKSLG